MRRTTDYDQGVGLCPRERGEAYARSEAEDSAVEAWLLSAVGVSSHAQHSRDLVAAGVQGDEDYVIIALESHG